MKMLLAPHNDDETLFASFTCMREQPLIVVVTDCYVQLNRVPSVSKERRRDETFWACRELGCSVVFLGIPDESCTTRKICEALDNFKGFETVYAPAKQGGHVHHDMTCLAACEMFDHVLFYGTYSTDEPAYATKGIPVHGEIEERVGKRHALECYKSQHEWSRAHFEAAKHHPEFLVPRD